MFFDLSVFLFIFPPFRWLLIFWLNLLAVRACFFVKNSRHSLAMRRQPQRQHQVQMGSIFFFIFFLGWWEDCLSGERERQLLTLVKRKVCCAHLSWLVCVRFKRLIGQVALWLPNNSGNCNYSANYDP